MTCPACLAAIDDGARFCPQCGASATQPSELVTATSLSGTESVSIPSQGEVPRFLPGSRLGDRYRIHGPLGRGGMGEVYRADDLKLGQPVALKFLPEVFEQDSDRLQRLLTEVRTARQVAHPSVCRVYDVGEIEGRSFLSMEFVDGEDLASLLRRIGRLPQDKAVEIARQICAGLAAAHEQGILHRDLKPANVMIDGRGRAKITDFGLAGLAEEIQGAEIRSGTPAYMSPEQLEGREVTVQSDLFALGLLLYELFTGKRPFQATTPAELMQMHRESAPVTPSTQVESIDPAVERVIMRCLERAPEDRPPSALAVAAALPGGDPIAAALAAGETPSPEMIAAAGGARGLSAGVGGVLMGLVVAALAVTAIYNSTSLVFAFLPIDRPFQALRENARQLVQELGYEESAVDTAAYMRFDNDAYNELVGREDRQAANEELADGSQQLLSMAYRHAPAGLVPLSLAGLGWTDPTPRPGEVAVRIGLDGRLHELRAIPETSPGPLSYSADVEWKQVFALAGLEFDEFAAVEPFNVPRMFADRRHAWRLRSESEPTFYVEAASFSGKPVYFAKIRPSDSRWPDEEDKANAASSSRAEKVVLPMVLTIVAVILVGALFLAARNLRSGRGDRRGAFRLALVVAGLRLLAWLFSAHHVASLGELYLILTAIAGALTLAGLTWLLYVALEPQLRRLWPQTLVSWSRVLAGQFRDPQVGRDLLVGFAAAASMTAIARALFVYGTANHVFPPLQGPGIQAALMGGRFAFGAAFQDALTQLATALSLMMLVLILRLVFRRDWAMVVAYSLIWSFIAMASFTVLTQGALAGVLGGLLVGLLSGAIPAWIATRYGLLAFVSIQVFSGWMQHNVLTFDASRPYFATGLVQAVFILAIAGFALHSAVTNAQPRPVSV